MSNALESTKGKRGRKPHDHQCSWDNKTIDGLYRRPGTNVWRIRSTGQEYTEPDERKAVARFYELMEKGRQTLSTLQTHATAEEAMLDLARRTIDAGGTLQATVKAMPNGNGWAVNDENLSPQQWAWLREQILTRPVWVAQRVGIEQIGWLTDLRKPEKATSLEALGQTYLDFCKLSPNELSRSKCFWQEFQKAAKSLGITTVDGISHEFAHKYEATIEGMKLAPKSRLHRYRKIGGILRFNIKRGNSIEHCRRALDVLAMLQVRNANPLDPTPISPRDFWAIYNEAMKAADTTFAALLLTALNGALYGGEVATVRWEEINMATGGFVSRRSKTGVSRIAILWPEVVTAIKALPRMRDEVFCTKVRSYTVYSVGDKFEKYRDAAGVDKGVTFSWIRDASYSTAMQATSFDKAELLAGHRLAGSADAYLRRNPQLVAEACAAIAKAFNVPANAHKAKP